MAVVKTILAAISGVKLVGIDVCLEGVMENTLAVLKSFRDSQRAALLSGAEAAGVDGLAAVYHACNRELCADDD